MSDFGNIFRFYGKISIFLHKKSFTTAKFFGIIYSSADYIKRMVKDVYNIIIVEDEPCILDFLVEAVGWEKIEVNVAGAYNDSKTAIENIIKKNPDIVITDINMPGITGLKLIEQIRNRGFKNSVVIISAYDNFKYVKEAFKLGVNDYLLKSELEIDELRSLILKLLKSSDDKGEVSQDYHSILIKENLLKSIIWGGKKIEETDNGILNKIIGKNYSVGVINLLNYNNILKKTWEDDSELLKYGITNILCEILDGSNCCEAFINEKCEIVFIFCFDNIVNAHKDAESLLKDTMKYLKDNLGFLVCGGYSGFESNSYNLKMQYENAKSASRYTFVLGRDAIVSYKEQINKKFEKIDFNDRLNRFTKCIMSYGFRNIIDNFNNYVFQKVHIFSFDGVFDIYEKYISALEFVISDTKQGQVEADMLKKALYFGNIDEFNMELYRVICELKVSFFESTGYIRQIKKYIDMNYGKNINLELLAHEFGINYKKLSHDFSEKTGMGFKKYLNEVRMKQAMNLIKESDYLLYEIAEKVGYANYENFSRVFYNYYGEWPKKYYREKKK